MSERDALLRAVLEDPHDDAPRRIFADWLMEYGDDAEQRWGAVIHEQLDSPSTERSQSLDGLLNPPPLHPWPVLAWIAEAFRGLSGAGMELRFHRGFVSGVRMAWLKDYLRSAAYMHERHPIMWVSTGDRTARHNRWIAYKPGRVPDGRMQPITIPYALFEIMEPYTPMGQMMSLGDYVNVRFVCDTDARRWLSDALVLYGRQEADLPLLEPARQPH